MADRYIWSTELDLFPPVFATASPDSSGVATGGLHGALQNNGFDTDIRDEEILPKLVSQAINRLVGINFE